jgi:hypothetical protein
MTFLAEDFVVSGRLLWYNISKFVFLEMEYT